MIFGYGDSSVKSFRRSRAVAVAIASGASTTSASTKDSTSASAAASASWWQACGLPSQPSGGAAPVSSRTLSPATEAHHLGGAVGGPVVEHEDRQIGHTALGQQRLQAGRDPIGLVAQRQQHGDRAAHLGGGRPVGGRAVSLGRAVRLGGRWQAAQQAR